MSYFLRNARLRKNLMTKLMDLDSLMAFKRGIQTGTRVMVLRGRSGCSFGALT